MWQWGTWRNLIGPSHFTFDHIFALWQSFVRPEAELHRRRQGAIPEHPSISSAILVRTRERKISDGIDRCSEFATHRHQVNSAMRRFPYAKPTAQAVPYLSKPWQQSWQGVGTQSTDSCPCGLLKLQETCPGVNKSTTTKTRNRSCLCFKYKIN